MDWNAIAAVGAAASAAVAGWQVRRIRADALQARIAEIRSVSMATLVRSRPRESEVHDGRATWVYEYTIQNPGRLPIFDVCARIHFPCSVQRLHSDGQVDPPTDRLELYVAVIPPLSAHPARQRSLLFARSDWTLLPSATVTVSFRTQDAGVWTNRFPAESSGVSRAILRRLRKSSS